MEKYVFRFTQPLPDMSSPGKNVSRMMTLPVKCKDLTDAYHQIWDMLYRNKVYPIGDKRKEKRVAFKKMVGEPRKDIDFETCSRIVIEPVKKKKKLKKGKK